MTKGVDHTGISIVYFCHDGKGSFVMARRGQNARDENGNWDIGGGALEFGSTVEETLKREVKEEYGADVLQHDFLGFLDVHRMKGDAKTHWIALCFKVLVDPAKVINNEPHKFDEVKWFTFSTMPPNLHSQLPRLIAQFKEKLA